MDSNTIVIKGLAAELRWGWHSAATLRSWELANWTATAKVVSVDDFKVTQRPLKFVAQTPSGQTWQWRVNSLQIAGDTISMSLAQE